LAALVSLAPAAQAHGCAMSDVAGKYGYTSSGTIVTPPVGAFMAVGHVTFSATINVLVNGQLQRSAGLALVYDNNKNHARMIFQSLTLPDGTNAPVVITIYGNRLFSKD
jgi:hypothetical protein